MVLIIGAGPSGIDLTYAIAETATKVIFSHHTHTESHVYPVNVIKKPAIKCFNRNSVIFNDDSEESITDVVFCTGILHFFLLPTIQFQTYSLFSRLQICWTIFKH